MTPGDPLDSRLDSATTELRSQLGASNVPDFEPNKRVAAPVAAIVAVCIAVGAVAFTQFGVINNSQVDVADDTGQVEAPDPDNSDALQDETPNDSEPSSGRTTTELVTSPDDVEITLGQDATQPSSNRSRPALGSQRNDPAYGSVVTRLTDAGGRFNRLDSNTRMMVNRDSTMLITHLDDGTIEYMNILDLETLETVATLDLEEESEVAWHPTDPVIVRHLSGGNESNGSLQLFETNVLTNETTVIADLTDRVQSLFPTAQHMISRHGRPGNEGNHWAWIIRDDNEDPLGAISYDLATDTILGSLADPDPRNSGAEFSEVVTASLVDGPGRWLSIAAAPTAGYVVLEYAQITTFYGADFTNIRAIENTGDTADVVALSDGRSAYVYTDFNAASETYGFITSVDLETLERTTLINLFDDANTSVQVSGTATNAPGWVLISTHSCKNGPGEAEPWTCNKVMVVEIGGQNRIVPLAHTYGCDTDESSWFAAPYASANRDLTRIYFTSDSGACTEGGEVFEIVVPDELREIIDGS